MEKLSKIVSEDILSEKKKKSFEEDDILVQGIGKYTFPTLSKTVQGKLKSLYDWSKKDQYDRIGKGDVKVLATMLNSLIDHIKKHEKEHWR